MDELERRKLMLDTFEAAAPGYDCRALRFFRSSAEALADALELKGDESVLDVATGTGAAALAIARRTPKGRVTGVDFSEGMLKMARRKADEAGIRNVEFKRMDMHSLDLPDGRFDAASIAFAIFFAEEMERQLRTIAAKVRPGGKVAVTCFKAGSFSPQAELLFSGVERYGVKTPPPSWKKIDDEGKLAALFESAGLTGTKVKVSHEGYYLRDVDEYWELVMNAGFRGLVDKVAPDEAAMFRAEHGEEVRRLATKDGIWLAVDVLIAVGVR